MGRAQPRGGYGGRGYGNTRGHLRGYGGGRGRGDGGAYGQYAGTQWAPPH
jgi:deoxyribodipyrimidine photo-lyase